MVKRFGFGKKEKLKSRKQIEDLFLNGQRFAQFPIRVTYQFVPTADEGLVQVGVTASKRYFKKAVDRNRIKRLLREAYRLQKSELVEAVKQKRIKVFVFFMYTDKTIASFLIIKEAMNKTLMKLQKQLPQINENPS
jgi:ribonuclease P protein component